MKYILCIWPALGLMLVANPVWAQGGQSIAAQETTVPGGALMLGSYLVLWAGLFAYLLVLSQRQRRLDDDIEALEKRLDELLELD